MSNDQGYLHWETPHYNPDTAYIDGFFVPTGMQGISKKPQASTLFHLKGHANNSILQCLYFGPEAPQRRDGIDFTLNFQVFLDDLLAKIRSIGSRGSWFYFCPFDRAADTFDAVSGETYKLVRPIARGVVAGVTSTTHPEVIYLDGTVDPTAADVSGQNVTANSTGLITVDYTPVYKVVLLGDVTESVGEINEILVSMTLNEVVAL